MPTKVFIDGSEGTTGLRINERFKGRDDIELIKIAPELRKDPVEIKKLINQSDVTFLCLPDQAAIEAAEMVENDRTVIIDASTAHRTNPEWAYGFPELSKAHRDKIRGSKRIAVPGCYASGFLALAYPLVQKGIMPADYPVAITGISGYSGGGNKLIARYEEEGRDSKFDSARLYAWPQKHKHLKEMKAIAGLSREPAFIPMTTNYHSGMVVEIPLFTDMLKGVRTPAELREFFADYYKGEQFIRVLSADYAETEGAVFTDAMAGCDAMEIIVSGNEERMVAATRFDNLGKGASGAAIQCLNIVLGCAEDKGLNL